MNWHSPEFVLVLVGITTVGWIVTSWIRARHGYPVTDDWGNTVARSDPEADRRIDVLGGENARLRAELSATKDRLANVERIVTDTGHGLGREIDALR